MQEPDLDLKELNTFCGTMTYHRLYGANLTDGIDYLMKNGYSWLITDVLISAKMWATKGEEFISIKLKVHPDKSATLTMTDGNYKPLMTQEYDYTDARVDIDMYFTDNVLLLTGEY